MNATNRTIPKWGQITSHPDWQESPAEERAQIRDAYFNDVVAPELGLGMRERPSAYLEWKERTDADLAPPRGPGLLRRSIDAIGDAAGTTWDRMRPEPPAYDQGAWREVTGSEAFQQGDTRARHDMRQQFFRDNIAPGLEGEERQQAERDFYRQTDVRGTVEGSGWQPSHQRGGLNTWESGSTGRRPTESLGEARDRAAEIGQPREDGALPLSEELFRGLQNAGRGVMESYYGTQAMLSGDEEERQRLLQKAAELRGASEQNQATMPNFTDIRSPGDAARWAIHGIGAMAPSVSSIMAGGAAGGKAGALTGSLAGPKGTVLGAVAGSVMGSFSAGYMLYAGGLYSDIRQQGGEHEAARNAALKWGAPASAVSIVMPMAFLGSVSGYLGKDFVRGRARNMLLGAGIGGVGEGTAEAMAEAFTIMGEEEVLGRTMTDEERRTRIINAGAAGGLMGTSMGAVGGGVQQRGDIDTMIDGFIADMERAYSEGASEEVRQAVIGTLESAESLTDNQRAMLDFLRTERADRNRPLNQELKEVQEIALAVHQREDATNLERFTELSRKQADAQISGTEALELIAIQVNSPGVRDMLSREAQRQIEGDPAAQQQATQDIATWEQAWRDHEQQHGLEPIDLQRDTGISATVSPGSPMMGGQERAGQPGLAMSQGSPDQAAAAEDQQVAAMLRAPAEGNPALARAQESMATGNGFAFLWDRADGDAGAIDALTRFQESYLAGDQEAAAVAYEEAAQTIRALERRGAQQQRKQAAIEGARQQAAAEGGDALTQTLAGEQAEAQANEISARENAADPITRPAPPTSPRAGEQMPMGPGSAGGASGQAQAGAPQAQQQLAGESQAEPGALTPVRVPVERIQVAPEAYQFRTEVNERGIDDRMEGIQRWDDLRAGELVLHERNDGTLFVADGHHRVDLARRLGQPGVNAFVLREAEGYSVEDARRLAAERNIASGSSTAIDAARLFRNTEGDPAQVLEERDLPRRSQIVRDGADIARLGGEAFGAVLNNVVSEKDGAAIGRAFEDPAQQLAAVEVFQQVQPQNDNQRALLVSEIRQAGFAESQGEQGGLFGDDPAQSLIGERVRVMDRLRQMLAGDRRLFATLNRNARAAEQAGNVIAAEQNQVLSDGAARAMLVLEHATTNPEINQHINEAARRVREGQSVIEAARGLKGEILRGAHTEASQPPATPDAGRGSTEGRGQVERGDQRAPAQDDARAAATSQQRLAGEPAAEPAERLTYRANGEPFATPHSAMASGVARRALARGQTAEAVPVEGGFAVRVDEAGAGQGLRGDAIDSEWTAFSASSGTRGIPRAEMPQIRAEHRGALANFLSARGIVSTEETVPANSLRPTQREFSEQRVQAAKDREGGDRAILVSADGHVVDGHHQWMVRVDTGEDVRVIRLDAPIDQVLEAAHEFPSSETDTLTLETQTEESLAAREQETQGAEQSEAESRRREAQRAQAARDADDFVLAGSDTAADQAMARGQDSLFSTRAQAAEGAPRASEIEALLANAPELADVQVIQSHLELPPQALMGMALRGINPNDVPGMFIGGDLYVIANNVESAEEGARVAVHEAVGHKGIRGVLGDDLVPVMQQVYRTLPLDPRGREALNEVLGAYTFLDRNNPDHQVTIAEEMIAHLTEKGWNPGPVRRAIAKIRELLRRYFPNMRWTDADVMALAERSREYLRRQQAVADGDSEALLFSFAGERAETADLHNLQRAQEALKQGLDAEAVRQATGWFRGADGQWRFEIDDSDARFLAHRDGIVGQLWTESLDRVLDHPKLFAAYPGLRDIDVVSARGMGNERGRFVTGRREIMLNAERDAMDQFSTLLHEIQHGIQHVEGFATGGNPADYRLPPMRERWLRDQVHELGRQSSEHVRELMEQYRAGELTSEQVQQRAQEHADEIGLNEMRHRLREGDERGAYRHYRRLYGEVEARNVQARQHMSEAERAETSPTETQDVPDSDVIVVYNGQEMANVPEPANAVAEGGESGGEAPYSQRSVVRGDGSESGISVADARRAADEFVADYEGNIPLDVMVVSRQEDAYGPENAREHVGPIKGAYHPASGRLVLVASNLRDARDGRKTLRHEVVGHYGLNTFRPEVKRAILDRILETEDVPSLRAAWRHVNENYPADSTSADIRAEEVFAFAAEQERGRLGAAWDRVLAQLNRALRQAGLTRHPLSRAELHELADTISREIREGRRQQQTFPASDDAQFSREESRFSLRQQGAKPTSADQVSEALQGIDGLGRPEVLDSANQLDLDTGLRLTLRGLDPQTVVAFHDDAGRLRVIAGNAESSQAAVNAAVVERVRQQGLKRVVGDRISTVTNRGYEQLAKETGRGNKAARQVLRAVRAEFTYLDPSLPADRAALALEVAARLNERGQTPDFVTTMLDEVRTLLGETHGVTDISDLGLANRAYLTRMQRDFGGKAPPEYQFGLDLSEAPGYGTLTDLATNLVDADGRPIDDMRVESVWTLNPARGAYRAFLMSQSDRLRESGNRVLVALGNRLDRAKDAEERRNGMVRSLLRPAIQKMQEGGKKQKKQNLRDFEQYWRDWENGRKDKAREVYERNSAVAAMVDAAAELFHRTGIENQTVKTPNRTGVWVKDGRRYRRIGKVAKGQFWPRVMRAEVSEAIRNPNSDPALWDQLVSALVDAGMAKDKQEAGTWLRDHQRDVYSPEGTNDFYAAMEKARGVQLPEVFYDYSIDVVMDYGHNWSRRISQIEHYGQKLRPGDKDAWEEAYALATDEKTKSYIGEVSQVVYGARNLGAVGKFMRNTNVLATGLHLTNFATASQNLVSGSGHNASIFGGRRMMRAYAELARDHKAVVERGIELGILGKDYLSLIRDAERGRMMGEGESGHTSAFARLMEKVAGKRISAEEGLREFTKWGMKWGGYNATEQTIRAGAMVAAEFQLADALDVWNKKPDSAAARKYRRIMRQNRLDVDALIRENGKGEETARYLRLMVNLPQGSYQADMVPLLFDTEYGKYFGKYGKFGTQASRTFWQQKMGPMLELFADPSATGKDRALAFADVLSYSGWALFSGYMNRWVRNTLFGMAFAGADLDEIWDRFTDGEFLLAASLLLNNLWNNAMSAGYLFGFFSSPLQATMDYRDRARVRNPMDPPAWAAIEEFANLTTKFAQQDFRLTGSDLLDSAMRTYGFPRVAERTAATAADLVGVEPTGARIFDFQIERLQAEMVRRDVSYIRVAAQRWADQEGIEARQSGSFSPGSTPNTPANNRIHRAVQLGNGQQARQLIHEELRGLGMDEQARRLSSIRSALHARHPLRIGGKKMNQEEREAFMRWARQNLPPSRLETIHTTVNTYDNTMENVLWGW